MKFTILFALVLSSTAFASSSVPSEVICKGINSSEEIMLNFAKVSNENGTLWIRPEMLMFSNGVLTYDDLDMRLRTREVTDSQGNQKTIYLFKDKIFLQTYLSVEIPKSSNAGLGNRTYEIDGFSYSLRYNCQVKY